MFISVIYKAAKCKLQYRNQSLKTNYQAQVVDPNQEA